MSISTVTIVGAGYMGGGIAQVLAIAGFDVTIADVSVDNANASLQRLRAEARRGSGRKPRETLQVGAEDLLGTGQVRDGAGGGGRGQLPEGRHHAVQLRRPPGPGGGSARAPPR